MSEAIDNRFEQYLEAVSDEYKDWWKPYAFMDEIDNLTWFEFELNSKTQDKSKNKTKQPEEKPTEKTQPILEAIREYRHEKKILIVGSSGAGKSTLLARVFWQTSQQARQDKTAPIPVLVELKAYQMTGDRSGIRGLILSSLESYDPALDDEDLKILLKEKRLLLLIDGLNELPQASAKTDLKNFCRQIPLVATARHAEDGWDIDRKLELQPPSAKQVERFFHERLPNSDRAQLETLGNRVKDFGQTPLMIWMLYSIFRTNREIPETRGEAYRTFTSIYTERAKEGIDLTESRFILSKLAFEMMQSQNKDDRTDFRLDISEVDAEHLLGSEATLKHLMNHHLLSWQGKPGNRKIRFCHQSLQEYYAAAYLVLEIQKYPEILEKMPDYKYAFFQQAYLNDVDWTESVALMVGLIGKAQAKQVVRLALEVDGMLGARLAGEVKREWQEQTVGIVSGLDVPLWLKVELWGKTRSDFAVEGLVRAIEDEKSWVRRNAATMLGNLDEKAVLPALLKALDDRDSWVRRSAIEALGNRDEKAVLPALLKALDDRDSWVRRSAVEALGNRDEKAVLPALLKALDDEDFNVRRRAVEELGKLGSEATIPGLLKALEDENFMVRRSTVKALETLSREIAIPGLRKALQDENPWVRRDAVEALGNLETKAAISDLLKVLEDEHPYVRGSAIKALGKLGRKVAIPGLLLSENEDFWVHLSEAEKIAIDTVDFQEVTPDLLQALEERDSDVRRKAAEALGKLDCKSAIPGLLQTLKDKDFDVRWSAAMALGKLGTEAVSGLLKALDEEDSDVRRTVAAALGKLGIEAGIPGLLKALEDENTAVRRSAVKALETLGSEAGIPGLLKALEDKDTFVRGSGLEGLASVKNDRAAYILPKLRKLIPKYSGKDAFRALTAIQYNCKFYDYDIFHSPPIPKLKEVNHPNKVLARIDETTQQIDERTRQMADRPKNDFAGATFRGPVNFGDNPTGNFIGTQNNYNFPDPKQADATQTVADLLQDIRSRYPQATDAEILDIIDRRLADMQQTNPPKWQKWVDLLSIVFVSGVEAVKMVAPPLGIPIEVCKRLYEIYDRNRQQLPESK
jgi:HEAT repeat protein